MKKNDPDSRPEREAGDDPNGVGRWDVSAAAVRTPEAERPKHWPTGDQQPNATPAQIEFARNWRDTPRVVFSSAMEKVDWNTRLVTSDAVAEISRLKAEDSAPMRVGGATLAAAAMQAELIDEYTIVTHLVLVGGGTPFFTSLDSWINLNLVETRTFPAEWS